jgi:SAM-dependent methyltransferase
MRIRKGLVRSWYELVSAFDRGGETTFLNYGYAPLDTSDPGLVLRPEQEKDRYAIQLYARVASAVDLRGKDVLEVGCGRGGGSAFILKHFGPSAMIGVDLARSAVAFCRRQHRLRGLSFFQGDAENLPFPSDSFDAVINLESSHNYPRMELFLAEVARVLRPGGYFLFADHRNRSDIAALHEQLKRSGLSVVEEESITANVVRALELDHDRRLALIQRKVPRIFRPTLQEFSGLKGSELYDRLRSGDLEYRRFVLQKPG